MTYSREDMEDVESEFGHLRNSWLRFMHELTDGTTFEQHVPPALMSACMKIIEAHASISLPTPDSNPIIGVELKTMADFGATMFIFGQFCMNDGLLASNMVACNCEKFDDEELKRFIG